MINHKTNDEKIIPMKLVTNHQLNSNVSEYKDSSLDIKSFNDSSLIKNFQNDEIIIHPNKRNVGYTEKKLETKAASFAIKKEIDNRKEMWSIKENKIKQYLNSNDFGNASKYKIEDEDDDNYEDSNKFPKDKIITNGTFTRTKYSHRKTESQIVEKVSIFREKKFFTTTNIES